jgi:hypothetical protein
MKNYLGVLIAAIALIIGVFMISNSYKYKFKTTENITVTGSAEKDFVSDQIVWTGNYTRKDLDLKAAYAALKEDESRIKGYLKEKGVTDNEMVVSAINIEKEFNTRYDSQGKQIGNDFTGYNLKQNVTVDSRDIAKVEKISREITELIQAGIEMNSTSPAYYYTKLSELKIDLLAKASADAKLRAKTIAENTGGSLGNVRKAVMGVFQITGQNSNEDYSYGGAFNTSNKNKTASITMKVDFAVD